MADNSTKIVITAEDRTQAALNSVRSSLTGMSSLAASFGASFAGLASAGGFVAFTKSAISSLAALDDMAEKTGATVESLSALSDIAKIGGHDLGTVEAGMVRLTKALAGGDDEAKAAGHALEQLGLKAADLRKLDTGTAMLEVAKALDKFADSGGKAALMQDLLGKAGAQQLPFLKDLAETGELNAKATAEQAAQAERLEKAWGGLKVAADDLGRSLAVSVMPGLERLSQAFAGGVVEGFASRWGAAFKGLAAGINETMAAAEEFLGKITFGKVAESHYQQAIAYRNNAKAIYAEMAALAPVDKTAGTTTPKGSLADYTTAAGGGSKASAKAKKSNIFDPEGDFDAAVQAALFESAKKGADEAAAATDKYNEALKKSAESLYAATDVGKFDALDKALADTQEAFNRGYIKQEQLDAINASLMANTDELKEQKNLAKDLGLTFSSAFEDAIVGGKKFSDVLKGLGDDIIRLITRKTITEPLANSVSSIDFGSLFSGLIPKYAQGTPYVPNDGLAYLHKGEQVIPAGMGGGSNVVVNVIESPGNGGRQEQRQQNGVNILDIFVEKVKTSIAGDISDGRGGIPSALQGAYGLNRAAGAY